MSSLRVVAVVAFVLIACHHDEDTTARALAAVRAYHYNPVPSTTTIACPPGSSAKYEQKCAMTDSERGDDQGTVALALASLADEFASYTSDNRTEISKLIAGDPSAIDALTEPIARRHSYGSRPLKLAVQNALVRALADGLAGNTRTLRPVAKDLARIELEEAPFKAVLPTLNDDALIIAFNDFGNDQYKQFGDALDSAEKPK